MSKFRPREVPTKLPDPALPNADWADTFEVYTARTFSSMKELAEQTVGTMPFWARCLLWVRNVVVVPFGLKSDGSNDVTSVNDTVGLFPVLEETANRIVLGLNDRHLDFRIVIEREMNGELARLRTTTLVRRHNVFGKAYIVVVTPFHKLIAATSMKQAV